MIKEKAPETVGFSRAVEIKYTPDVLVIGAGPAGLCAAIASARCGADTLLIEKNGYCGGMATAGLVAPFMTCYDSEGGVRLIRGLFGELVERMVRRGGAIDPKKVPTASEFTSYIEKGHLHVTPFDAEALKSVADELLAQVGVKTLYHTGFIACESDGGKVERVIIAEKQGLCAVRARCVVDCTGDGDAAADAGFDFLLGDGTKMQPATTFFRIGNVDTDRVNADIAANRDRFFRKNGINYRSFHWRVAQARENGDWKLDRVSIGMFRGVRRDEWSINTSRIMNVNGTSSESLTAAEIEGRRQVREIFDFLVKYVPGCENAVLLSVAPTVGIRETRHIYGIETLTLDAVLTCKIPQNPVLLAANSVDVHGKFGPLSNEYVTVPAGKWYGVPYGCLVPRGSVNLFVAGRCISAESDAAGAIRVMPPCMALGQAAGVAAALCAAQSIPAANLEYSRLRIHLLKQNVYLGQE